MNKTLKYLVKLYFVIILPTAILISSISLVIINWKDMSPLVIFAISIGCLVTVFNAVFYGAVLSNTELLPKIRIQTELIIGFCIAYDRNRMKPSISIVIPFVVIEISPNIK